MASSLARCDAAPRCQWISTCAVVAFDVDVGHVLEAVAGEALDAADEATLCTVAMPDSQPSSGGLGDVCFAFTLLRDADREMLWGFSLFRAKRDPNCKRGVFQKAVVLLSPLPFFRLFRSAVTQLAEAYFRTGVDALHEAIRHASAWPAPREPGTLELPFVQGRQLSLYLAPCGTGPAYAYHLRPRSGSDSDAACEAAEGGASDESRDGKAQVEALREPLGLGALRPLGRACWTLWQLMLMGESIVVRRPRRPLPPPTHRAPTRLPYCALAGADSLSRPVHRPHPRAHLADLAARLRLSLPPIPLRPRSRLGQARRRRSAPRLWAPPRRDQPRGHSLAAVVADSPHPRRARRAAHGEQREERRRPLA